jgi:aromatic-L-amino-acid decarboxylase
MWLPLHLFGIAPFRACLEEKILLTRYFYEEVQKIGFEVGNYPELSVAIYRYVPKNGEANEFNERLVQHLQKDGRIFISSTNLKGVYWIRIALLSFRTHLNHVDLYLKMLQEAIIELE